MIPLACRRIPVRYRNILTTGKKNNDIASIAKGLVSRSLSSSMREKNVADDGGSIASVPMTPDPFVETGLEHQSVSLKPKERVAGYLNRILNARVYEAAIETELEHAKNLSAVCPITIGLMRLAASYIYYSSRYCNMRFRF